MATTVTPAFPPVRVVSGPAFELIAELAAFTSGPARASLESGKPWIRQVRALAGPELIRRVEGWGFSPYAELASIALETGPPHDVDQFLDRLRSLPPDVVRRRLVGAESAPSRAMVSAGAFDRALAGDAAARVALRDALGHDPQGRESMNRLLTTSSEAVQADMVSIVKAWASRVLPQFAGDALVIIARDVVSKEQLFKTGPARHALQIATNGVDVDPAAWAATIVVVPTVAMRPFIAPIECGSTAIFLCSVADEAYDVDPDAPPRGLVKITTAIGDDLRLRILRVLTDEALTASEVATRLGIERTSLHHHLGILRSAGLVAIRDDGFHHWRYSRRGARISDVGSVLATYLDPPVS